MIHHLFEQFKNLVLPPLCASCKIFLSEPTIFCQHCKSQIYPVVSLSVPLVKDYEMTVFAISAYQDPLKALILSKNYSNIIASKQLGALMWEFSALPHVPFDYLVPIPLHWTRFARRGFNQSHEIAKVLSHESGKPVAELLARSKRTQFQAALDQQQRQLNIKDAFRLAVANNMYEGKHLVLVDDLFTTGATLRIAARELVKLKPAKISAVVACRVV